MLSPTTFFVLDAFLPQGKSYPRSKSPFSSRDCLAAASSGINKTTKYSYTHTYASNSKNPVKITSH